MPRKILVLGGARSGKSRRAQAIAEGLGPRRLFIATAEAFDDEMAERIRRHRADRDASWQTVEVPRDLPGAILAQATAGRPILVDCLTLWLSNLLLGDADLETAGEALAQAVLECAAPLVMVANEVGFGIVPENALARRFRDAAGRLNQRIAAAADTVELVVAGLPWPLKGPTE
ncbi:bifunctional adenosylcobinamide kinase/adenosylcobinamide-phosphate guanylyltransferase [Sandaracinobacter sp. RS1-74]|uniref:bifunctional adenosylcobinamide kinase/adenosylcobinamide-phosphate guanylyltransferase n=1 Tax=Sandaracinobacteroides sayramensis TaxID=2913411 RepID=UPI001EDC8433|nr:bifunctional adenosylcobinamide kinase/adenosylcobinamide-phosphate guanylyltransferase [Sandaracinobacteroides sayramensis]MCG2841620.1 bifunctional adenosylcobinamide kinase/adenosylcobinamide-phosphate guanylyltransferase [Sandaracinobacteroides sayramensis]